MGTKECRNRIKKGISSAKRAQIDLCKNCHGKWSDEARGREGDGGTQRRQKVRGLLWGAKVDVQLVTVKNFVCQLQFPSDAGTSRENGWVEVWEGAPSKAGPWTRVKYYSGTFSVGHRWALQE